MRVGVIRGDVRVLFVGDIEVVSQYNPAVETRGQERYLKRPTPASVSAVLAKLGLSASSAAVITATVPVGGPVNVSPATIRGVAGLGAATDGQVTAIQDVLAPHIVETDVALKSFKVGHLHGYASASFNPDPRRIPAIVSGPAISVVADDGSTPFTVADTAISGAVAALGAITISGTGLGSTELLATTVKVTKGASQARVSHRQIVAAGGSVSSTSIVVPASLLHGLGVAGSKVQVQYTSFLSNLQTVV